MNLFQHISFDLSSFVGKRILDIGCGRNKLPGAVGMDCLDLPGIDLVADLNKPLPFDDEQFEVIYSNQVLEHIQNLVGLIEEIHRVLRPGGIMVAHVPYFRSSWAAVDPTHVRQFTLNSLHYFVRGTYEHNNYRLSETSFSQITRYLDSNYPPGPIRFLFTSLALRWPYRYENTVLSFLYPFQTLDFVLTK